MKQQYKKVPNSWKFIRRFDEPEKVLSEKAVNILSAAMYQVNKYGQAILTHKVLKEITDRKKRQNCNLVRQLGFVFNLEFSRCLIENNKKYNDAYKLILTEKAEEILENPEEYFANYGVKIAKKDRVINITTSGNKNIEDGAKNCLMSGKKLPEVAQKITPSHKSLHIYIKKLIYIINKKTNVDLDIDLYMQIMGVNLAPMFAENTPEQIENFTQLLAKNSPFNFYDDCSPESFKKLHTLQTFAELKTPYQTEFQKLANKVNEEWYHSYKKKEATC